MMFAHIGLKYQYVMYTKLIRKWTVRPELSVTDAGHMMTQHQF